MYLLDSSIFTPLGIGAPMVACAIKSGVSCVRETPYISKSGEPMKMSLVPDEAMTLSSKKVKSEYPSLTARQSFLLRLCHSALTIDFKASLPLDPIPLFLAGPDGFFSQYSQGLTPGFIEALASLSDVPLDLNNSRILSLGRTGVLNAIEYAFSYMESTSIKQVLIGGVDSFRDYSLLGKLDSDDRILYSGSVDSFAPSEGAGFILLSSEKGQYNELKKHVRLMCPGSDNEQGAFYSSEAYLGDGLHQATKKALKNSKISNIRHVYSSMNGESYWARELGILLSRNSSVFDKNVEIQHPADCIGDLGAAYGAVVISCLSEQKPGNYLVYGSSDSPNRSAVCVEIRE